MLCLRFPEICWVTVPFLQPSGKDQAMTYYISKTITASYQDAVTKTREALKAEGFGVLTEIDVKATLKQKLGVEFPNHVILGACNPPFAHQALQAEPHVGLLLPCNVVVQEKVEGTVEISAIDPVAAMQVVGNDALKRVASEVREKLCRVVSSL
jgi:uncharacterized protein (DUF302 family)